MNPNTGIRTFGETITSTKIQILNISLLSIKNKLLNHNRSTDILFSKSISRMRPSIYYGLRNTLCASSDLIIININNINTMSGMGIPNSSHPSK